MKVKKYFFKELMQCTNRITQKFYSGTLFWLYYPHLSFFWIFLSVVLGNYMSIFIQYHSISWSTFYYFWSVVSYFEIICYLTKLFPRHKFNPDSFAIFISIFLRDFYSCSCDIFLFCAKTRYFIYERFLKIKVLSVNNLLYAFSDSVIIKDFAYRVSPRRCWW